MLNFKSFLQKNLRNEFDANLENHPLGSQTVYRLRYIQYYRAEGSNGIRKMDWPFDPFMLPNGMSRGDAFTVLSYLTDYIERTCKLEPCSYKSVETLNSVLDLERLGFRKLDINTKYDETNIIDLWTVTGRVLLFKESSYYSSYFNWYSENVTLAEVQRIYKKLNIEFYDLISK